MRYSKALSGLLKLACIARATCSLVYPMPIRFVTTDSYSDPVTACEHNNVKCCLSENLLESARFSGWQISTATSTSAFSRLQNFASTAKLLDSTKHRGSMHPVSTRGFTPAPIGRLRPSRGSGHRSS